MKIGWIGLGKMGVPMAEQLLNAGHDVTVYNRTKEKTKPLVEKGASAASSPSEIARKTEVIFVMVSDDEAIREVFTAKDGILAGLNKDKIVVNTSTISPEISKEMAKKCRQANAYYIDSPVSGSVPQAEGQTLVSIAGGEETAFKKVKPLLQTYSKKVLHTGDAGTGNATKLAVNAFLGIVTEGLAEVIAFAESAEINPQNLMEVLNNSALGSPFVKMKGEAALNENYEAAFTLKHLAKDLRLAKQCGLKSAVSLHVHDLFQDAENEFGAEDVMAIIKYLRKKSPYS